MKPSRIYLSSLAVLLLVSAVTLAVKYRPHTLSEEECSPLYRQYAHVPGIEASYVQNYHVNDSVTLSATLLHATDSTAWQRLAVDFEMPSPISVDDSISGNKTLMTRISKKGQTKLDTDSVLLNNDFIAIAPAYKTISIFHITDNNQLDALYYYTFDLYLIKYTDYES